MYVPNDHEVSIIKHSLGLDRSDTETRNHYNTGEGSDDFDACENLVKHEMMTKHDLSWIEGFIYYVTDKGRIVIGVRDEDSPK